MKIDEKYWQENYSDLESMDGIGNAHHHAQYAKALFQLEYIDISSLVDWGAGYGHLLEAFVDIFQPYKVEAIEPSEFAFSELQKRNFKKIQSTRVQLKDWDLQEWCKKFQEKKRKWFDLGLCNSVFQYMSLEQLKEVIPVMSMACKYLYFSVPTDKELQRQVEDLDFHDRYAYSRTREAYDELILPHFSIVSSRVLESRYHFKEEDTFFTDLYFRR